jgi:hypothetical protein
MACKKPSSGRKVRRFNRNTKPQTRNWSCVGVALLKKTRMDKNSMVLTEEDVFSTIGGWGSTRGGNYRMGIKI